MPALSIFFRSADPNTNTVDTATSSNPISPIDIAGFCLAAVAFLTIAIVLIKYARKRALARREDARGAAFLNVRGLVKDNENVREKAPLPQGVQSFRGTAFSRQQITSDVVFPSKAHTLPPLATHGDVIRHHTESGNFPRPFSFALSATSPPISPIDRSSALPPSRQSFRSAVSNRLSFLSTSSASSSRSNGPARKVHQLYTPVLPDELFITHVGERLTVVQSFDDGWCVVGRRSAATTASGTPSLSKSNAVDNATDLDVELGVIPAWCFMRPVKGLRAERPVRSSSLGVTVHMDGSGFSSRNELISWSNF